MVIPELPPRLEGEPGSIIDEGYSVTEEKPFLDISVFNEEGDLIFYTDYPKNVSPEQISDDLKLVAMNLPIDPPSQMVWEEVVEMSKTLAKESKRIPGLKKQS